MLCCHVSAVDDMGESEAAKKLLVFAFSLWQYSPLFPVATSLFSGLQTRSRANILIMSWDSTAPHLRTM